MECDICHNTLVVINDLQKKEKYNKCSNCQIIKLAKEHILNEQKEKSQYENHNNSFESIGYVRMFENFLDYFWNDLPKNCTKALDFGSGPGPMLSKIIINRGLNVDCYDKFYQPEKVYENKKYDLITSTEVLEHIQDPLNTLIFFKDHLKAGGLIAIMTLFHNNDTEEFLNWWYRRDPTHITFYTPLSFEVLAEICGLGILKHDSKRIVVLTSLS